MKKGPVYYTKTDAPNPEKSASAYIGKKYDARFESYYENDWQKTGFTTPFLKYQGPKNSLNLGEPVTEGDAAAKKHDILYAWWSYRLAHKKITQQQFEKKIRETDNLFQKENTAFTPVGLIGKIGIGIKQKVESVTGQLYPGSDPKQSEYETASEPHNFVPYKPSRVMTVPKRPAEGESKEPKKQAVGDTAEAAGTQNVPLDADTEMPMTGTGKEQASGGASSDGMEVHTIERPFSNFGYRESVYTKSHKFMTFGLAPAFLSSGPASQRFLTTYLAEIPWHLPCLYLNQSEFILLQDGARCKSVHVQVTYRGSTIQFETAASTSGLATLNQINDIAVCAGLNRTGWGSNISFTGFEADRPMIPNACDRPKYGPVASNYIGMERDYYGNDNTAGTFESDVPNHQLGRHCFLYNYWAMTSRINGINPEANMNGGWPAIAEKITQMDGKTVVNQVVLESSYEPKLAPLKNPLRPVSHGLPFPTTQAGNTINVPMGGQFAAMNNANVTQDTATFPPISLRMEVNQTGTGLTNDQNDIPAWDVYRVIEKSQAGRSGFWGNPVPHIQPSLHVGVQPVPALKTADLLVTGTANGWTDTRAYWEVKATMVVAEHAPTAYPYADNANVPVGENIMWMPAGQQPAILRSARDDGATFAGLYPRQGVTFTGP